MSNHIISIYFDKEGVILKWAQTGNKKNLTLPFHYSMYRDILQYHTHTVFLYLFIVKYYPKKEAKGATVSKTNIVEMNKKLAYPIHFFIKTGILKVLYSLYNI